jgi:hypothetical protein
MGTSGWCWNGGLALAGSSPAAGSKVPNRLQVFTLLAPCSLGLSASSTFLSQQTSHQQPVLFSHNKSASATSQTNMLLKHKESTRFSNTDFQFTACLFGWFVLREVLLGWLLMADLF